MLVLFCFSPRAAQCRDHQFLGAVFPFLFSDKQGLAHKQWICFPTDTRVTRFSLTCFCNQIFAGPTSAYPWAESTVGSLAVTLS